MANADTPFGLRPIRHKSGAPYNGAANPYYKPSTYATAMFIGDVVTRTSTTNTANVSVVGGTFIAGTLPEINRTTPGDSNSDAERQTGVVVGFGSVSDPRAANVHSAASTEAVVWVCDDPDIVFEAQADNAIAVTEVGLNAILIDTHSGDTNTGLSGTEIDGGSSTAPAADASYQVRILRGVNREDNEMNLVHNKIEVVLNVHTEMQAGSTNAIGTLGQ